jgi:alanine racemase
MPRPIRATIHYAALQHNLKQIQSLAPNAKVWAVVKANAYGHCIDHVYQALRGADGFALLELEEAQALRTLGWRGPILLLEGVFEPRDLEICSKLGLWHTVHNEQQVQMLSAHKTQIGHRIFLKMNSGMNRLGFDPHVYRSVWSRLNGMHQVDEISLLTHFARTKSFEEVMQSLSIFNQTTLDLPGERSLCNSAAVLQHFQRISEVGVSDDWVRPGIALYGASPNAPNVWANQWGLLPAQSLRSQIIAIQLVKKNAMVGYGSDFVAKEDMLIGVVACGYADGYPRVIGPGAQLLAKGDIRCHLFGRVSMDMLTVNLNPCLQAGLEPEVGDIVTLWGVGEQGVQLPIDEVAGHAGTIGYELMCALNERVPVVLEGQDTTST